MQALLEILYTNNLSKSYKEPVRYTSAALCAVGTSVTLHYLRPLHVSVCLLYKTFSLSLHISEEPLITLLPCLLLPCYRVSYYSVPCLEYPVTMSLITLYHVLHYSVTMSYITLSHQGMQNHKKKVDKLIIPRSHTPQNN